MYCLRLRWLMQKRIKIFKGNHFLLYLMLQIKEKLLAEWWLAQNGKLPFTIEPLK